MELERVYEVFYYRNNDTSVQKWFYGEVDARAYAQYVSGCGSSLVKGRTVFVTLRSKTQTKTIAQFRNGVRIDKD